ncbi:MAG: ribonuclease HII [bacterium]|nr:ribonuclease HII [bacterium]
MSVCGLDECGRGALAGPLVAAAVVLTTPRQTISRLAQVKLKDSKLLKPHQHRKIYRALVKTGATIRVEVISHRQINTRGIGWANREIFRRLIHQIEADEYIADGTLKLGRFNGKSALVHSVINADAIIPATIAAGIVAKVERDKLMLALHKEFPKYGWKTNTGHGTRKHIQAIVDHGSTKYHRSVFVTTALRNNATRGHHV